MKPLAGRVASRPSSQKPPVYKTVTIPAPTLGIIANTNISEPPPGGAEVLDNYLSTATGAILRRGTKEFSNVGSSDDIEALFAYVNGNNRSIFAATETAIFDVTNPSVSFNLVDHAGNALVTHTGDRLILSPSQSIAPSVTGLGSAEWVAVQFATPGGVFLRIVNGVDIPRVYNGATWAVTPSITGTDPSKFSYAWVYKQRMFFIEKDSLNAWYLAADNIGGAAVELPLGGVFTRGGSLLFGSSWSLETGAGGLSEQCIFVTTEGEVAVFQGSDPSVAASWSKVGIYRIGKPLGMNAHFRAGGDIVIATDIGDIPLSSALQKDFAVLAPSAVSAPIETIWNREVKARPSTGWSALVWSANQMAIIKPAEQSGQPQVLYIVNTRTGAWSKWTGWDVKCMLIFNDRLFYGSKNGLIAEGNVTGLDFNNPFIGVYVPLFSDFGAPVRKIAGMTRVITRSVYNPGEQVSMQRDYRVVLPPPPEAVPVNVGNTWGSAIWGQSKWGGEAVKMSYGQWKSTPQNGDALAPAVQIPSASASPLDAELVRTDVTFQLGDVVV